MNEQEPKNTIEQLLDECYTMMKVLDHTGYRLWLSKEGDVYRAQLSPIGSFDASSAVRALTLLKNRMTETCVNHKERLLKETAKELAEAQAKVSALLATQERWENYQ